MSDLDDAPPSSGGGAAASEPQPPAPAAPPLPPAAPSWGASFGLGLFPVTAAAMGFRGVGKAPTGSLLPRELPASFLSPWCLSGGMPSGVRAPAPPAVAAAADAAGGAWGDGVGLAFVPATFVSAGDRLASAEAAVAAERLESASFSQRLFAALRDGMFSSNRGGAEGR